MGIVVVVVWWSGAVIALVNLGVVVVVAHRSSTMGRYGQSFTKRDTLKEGRDYGCQRCWLVEGMDLKAG